MKYRGLITLGAIFSILGAWVYWDLQSENKKQELDSKQMKLISLPKSEIQKIVIKGSSGEIVFQKENKTSVWYLESPLKDMADSKLINELLNLVESEKAVDLVVEGENIDWKNFGLEDAKLKIEYFHNQGQSQGLLVSDQQNFEFNVYVRRLSENKIFTASSNWQTQLDKKVNDFRDKSLIRSGVEKIKSIAFKNQFGRIQLQKEDTQWILLNQKQWVLDSQKLNALKSSLQEAHVIDFINENEFKSSDLKKFGLDKPLAEINIEYLGNYSKEGDRSKQILPSLDLIVAKFKDDQYAYIKGESKIYKLDPISLSQFINTKITDLRDKTLPFKFNKDEVKKIEVQTSLKKFDLNLVNNNWKLEKDSEKFKVNESAIQDLFNNLAKSKVVDYQTSEQSVYNNFLIFKNNEGRDLFKLSWSEKSLKKDSKSYILAKTNVFLEPFIIDESTIHGYSLQKLVEEQK